MFGDESIQSGRKVEELPAVGDSGIPVWYNVRRARRRGGGEGEGREGIPSGVEGGIEFLVDEAFCTLFYNRI